MVEGLGSKPQSTMSSVAKIVTKKRTIMFGHVESMADLGKRSTASTFNLTVTTCLASQPTGQLRAPPRLHVPSTGPATSQH